MRLGLLVTLLVLVPLAGCRVHVHGEVRQEGYVPPSAMVRSAPGDTEVRGSDGTFGWQRTCDADVTIHEISERMARTGCELQSYGYDETRATCEGVPLLLRRDARHVYRLCPPESDRAACTAAWARAMAN
jgi:hypothetical protein